MSNQLVKNGEAPPEVKLTIRVDPQGSVIVEGPIHDRFLCYALLGAGEEELRRFWAQQAAQAPRIVPATILPPGSA